MNPEPTGHFAWLTWPLLLSAVFLLAACDRKSPSAGEVLGPSSTPLSKARSTNGAQAAQQDAGKSASRRAANSPSPDPTAYALRSPQTRESAPAEVGFPLHGGPLLPEEAHRLLSGTINFNPVAIPSSNVAIEPDTPLELGQDLQVKYGGTWWAGTILGFEPDGRVRIHYFGWAASWDEAKSRAELQLDSAARVRALDSTYVRKNW
jgi:hypothetical protein